MAKANLVLSDGTKVTIEGTSEEVTRLLAHFSGGALVGGEPLDKPRRSTAKKSTLPARERSPKGPVGHIRVLRGEQFFKSRRTLGDIRKRLEEKGHIYDVTSLSPALVRLVRNKELRRIKEKKGWVYVS